MDTIIATAVGLKTDYCPCYNLFAVTNTDLELKQQSTNESTEDGKYRFQSLMFSKHVLKKSFYQWYLI